MYFAFCLALFEQHFLGHVRLIGVLQRLPLDERVVFIVVVVLRLMCRPPLLGMASSVVLRSSCSADVFRSSIVLDGVPL